MDEDLTTPHCPVCEEEVTDRKVYFRVKPDEATMPLVQNKASMADTLGTQEEEMILLGCGHAFPADPFNDFWNYLMEWQELYQSFQLLDEHPKGTPLGLEAVSKELHDTETLIGRAADECREEVVSEPEVSLP